MINYFTFRYSRLHIIEGLYSILKQCDNNKKISFIYRLYFLNVSVTTKFFRSAVYVTNKTTGLVTLYSA